MQHIQIILKKVYGKFGNVISICIHLHTTKSSIMNIVKELHNTARKNYELRLKEADAALDSVKANLDMQDKADRKLLQYFGTDDIVFTQTVKKKTVTELMNDNFVTELDIKKICLKYHLRFLPTSLYKKEVPLSALNDLRKFKEQNEIEEFSDSLFIIAPASHFKLGKRPVKDPVLLYKVPSGDGYAIISKWGNDFTFWRLFLRPLSSPFLLGSILISAFTLLSIWCGRNYDKSELANESAIYYLAGSVFSGMIAVISFVAALSGDGPSIIKRNFWNEPYV